MGLTKKTTTVGEKPAVVFVSAVVNFCLFLNKVEQEMIKIGYALRRECTCVKTHDQLALANGITYRDEIDIVYRELAP